MSEVMQWVDNNWMFVAPPCALAWFLYKLSWEPAGGASETIRYFYVMSWLVPFVYALHQFEEHGYGFYGRRYHFMEYFNEVKPLGVELTPGFITLINLVEVHFIFGVFARWSEQTGNPIFGVLSHSISSVNAFGAHLLPALAKQAYNPGVVQCVFMANLSGWVLYRFCFHYCPGADSIKALVLCLVFGGPWGHGFCLLLPLRLCHLGYLSEWGFTLWSAGFLILYAFVASKMLPSSKHKKGSMKD